MSTQELPGREINSGDKLKIVNGPDMWKLLLSYTEGGLFGRDNRIKFEVSETVFDRQLGTTSNQAMVDVDCLKRTRMENVHYFEGRCLSFRMFGHRVSGEYNIDVREGYLEIGEPQ